jgi:hypothetical protein
MLDPHTHDYLVQSTVNCTSECTFWTLYCSYFKGCFSANIMLLTVLVTLVLWILDDEFYILIYNFCSINNLANPHWTLVCSTSDIIH